MQILVLGGTSFVGRAMVADAPRVLPDPRLDVGMRRSADLARTVGLTATPLEQTAADVVVWDRERGEPPLAVGLPADRGAVPQAAAER